MDTKKINSFLLFMSAMCFCSVAGAATTHGIYDNGIAALNLNMLQNTFATYSHRDTNLADMFEDGRVYGKMSKYDVYGDDGSTVKTSGVVQHKDALLKNIWADFSIVDINSHYSHAPKSNANYKLMTIGGSSEKMSLQLGDLNFGGFVNYILGDAIESDVSGGAFGVFGHYKYKTFDSTTMINSGVMENKKDASSLHNSWFDISTDASIKMYIDETFVFQPKIYAGFNWISSDTIHLGDENFVSSDNFSIFNVTPEVKFIKSITAGLYGALSAKYFMPFGSQNDIKLNDEKYDTISMHKFTEIGLDMEYDYENIILSGALHKYIGCVDAWVGTINIKYAF